MALPRSVLLALVLAAAPSSAQNLLARMNCGGPLVSDALGRPWAADGPYLPGVRGGYEDGVALTTAFLTDGQAIGGPATTRRNVLASARAGWTAYRFEVPDGDYVLRLSFAEFVAQGPGLRVMDLVLEGQPLATALDLAATFGVQYGGELTRLVTVVDGRLDLEATAGSGGDPRLDGSFLNGIELWSAPAAWPAPPEVRELVAEPSYGANLLSWAPEDTPVAGWRVWRAPAPASKTLAATPPGAEWTRLADLPCAPTRFHDRTAPAGEQLYRVAALGLDGRVGPRSPLVSAATLAPATTSLPRYRITLSAADQLFLDANILAQPDEEVPATFQAEGAPVAAETRYRGNTSRYLSKKAWKLKFSEETAYHGRRELNLKASFLDPALIREALASRLFQAVGVNAFDVEPVHLEVNGRYLGVFNQAEELDEDFFARRARSTTGDLFEAESNLTLLGTSEEYAARYDKKTNESTGHAELIAWIEFLNAPPGPEFTRELADGLDLDAYLGYLAVIAWIADRDSILHNYYLYRDHELGRWEVLPWDNDVSFALVPSQLELSILLGTSAVPGDQQNRLREVVLARPELLWRFCQKVAELEERFASPDRFSAEVDAATNARRADAHADPFKYGWESDEPYEADIVNLRTYAERRAPHVDAEIALVQPASPPTPVWLNEFAAERQTLVTDEQGEAEDWLELFNAGASPLDVGGWRLSDDLGDPARWMIPSGTSIPAGGHLVVWCDGEPADGPLHANFTLAAAGGELGLFDASGALRDFASWTRQAPELARGRWRDGGAYFETLATPTPGFANTLAGNLPPRLAWVEHRPAVPRSIDAVTITCEARDADGLGTVELAWRADGGAFTHVSLAPLGASRFGATLPAQPVGTVIDYWLRATDTLGAETLQPPEGAAQPFTFTVVDPGFDLLRVNELVASNATTASDELGDFDDWIELWNGTAQPIDLGGMFLSDDLGNPTKWEFPVGSVIGAGGYLLVWADDEPLEGPLHATFRLGAGGEAVGLFDTLARGNGLVDGFAFGAQTSDVAFGALPDGGALRFLLPAASPGATNLPASGASHAYRPAPPATNALALAALGATEVGGSLSVEVSLAPSGAAGFFVAALAPDSSAVAGGTLLVASPPFASVPFTADGAGSAFPSLAIPNDPGLVGLAFFSQAFVLGGALSNGLVTTIGP